MPKVRRLRFWQVAAAIVLIWIVAFVLTLRHGDRNLYPGGKNGVTVYLVSNGFHTDLALPGDAVLARGGLLAQSGQVAERSPWLVYGWGDSSFFTGSGMSLGRAADGLRALFHPGNPSVIRVFGIHAVPDRAFADAQPIVLSQAGFEALARRMEASFAVQGGALVVDPISATGDVYFTSTEHFSIFRLCNNWTADQLSAAGLPTAPMIDGLAPLLSLNLKLRAGVG